MHKEFQFMLVIMSVQMDYRIENVKKDGDIVKTQGRHHFWYIFSKPLDAKQGTYLEGLDSGKVLY